MEKYGDGYVVGEPTMVQIQTVKGWYCPECNTFNVIDNSLKSGDEDQCEDCGWVVEFEKDD